MTSGRPTVTLDYYRELLCIWAYVSQVQQVHIAALQKEFTDRIRINRRYLPLFGDTAQRIGRDHEGGFERYAEHLATVAAAFDRIAIHRDVWRKMRPASVLNDHLEAAGSDIDQVRTEIDAGNGYATMARDMNPAKAQNVDGSSTLLLNERRQKLNGNFGYEAIAANVRELLAQRSNVPAWC